MCHIPLFCWITATVLEDMLKSREERELPRTLTQIYSHYVVIQNKVKTVKFDGGAATDPHWSPRSREMMESLGKLAFEQLQKGNLIFYESDLTECGMDLRAASVCSGVFTQVFREESSLYQDKVFTFIHLSLQEFLAALHVHQTFISSKVNLLEHKPQKKKSFKVFTFQKPTLNLLHQSAVDEALQSPNGHLDLFLRFLLGLSLPTNQRLLQGLLTQTGSHSQTNQRTVKYIKKKLSESLSTERSINLFHCLNEVNDRSLLGQIQESMRSGGLSTEKLSPAQWSALVFILLSSQEHLDVFDLKSFSPSEEAFLKLLPVVKASKKVEYVTLEEHVFNSVTDKHLSCGLSERSCAALSSVLSSQSSSVKHLDLSNNDLQDSGVMLLCEGLKSPHCKLDSLSLSGCVITEVGGVSLAVALSSISSSVRELDLSYNHPGDSAVKLLSQTLNTLRLSSCGLSEISCAALSSVLSSQSSSMKHLDLSNNDLQDSGVKLLCEGLKSPHCKLDSLSLSGCVITEVGGASLAAALSSNSSSVRDLDLSYNHPGDSAVKLNMYPKSFLLGGGNKADEVYGRGLNPVNNVMMIIINKSCAALSSVLSSQSSSMKHLDMSNNDLQDSGVKLLCEGLKSPHCKLDSLSLSGCVITVVGGASLAAALSSNSSSVKELDLSYNHPGDSAVKLLSQRLNTLRDEPKCKLLVENPNK
uniref:NLRC3 n=1 Tax=Gouania willdenowi TaxID=441366 RepID=A0A8C5DGP0_GOUWI